MEKIKKLNIITGIVLAGFIIAIIYHFILGTIFHLGYPYNTFLFVPEARFSDFTDIYRHFKYLEFNPYNQNYYVPYGYFPFGAFFQYLFRNIPVIYSFIIFEFTIIMFFFFYNYSNIKKEEKIGSISKIIYTIIISFLTFPFLIWIDRGNLEGFIFVFLALFCIFFINKKYTKSAFFLSLPIAMKGGSIIFIALLLAKKRFKEVFYCLSFTFLLTIVPLFFMKGSILSNILFFSEQMKLYIYHYAIHHGGLGFGSSLFGFIKFIIFWLNGCFTLFPHQIGDTLFYFNSFLHSENNYIYDLISKALGIFTPIAGILSLLIIIYVIFREKEFWKQLLLLVICGIIFTPVSGDYKLLSLYLPMWLFIKSEIKLKTDLMYAILFGLILIPKSYIQFFNPQDYSHFSISIILNPLILLIMAIMIIAEGFIPTKNVSYNLNLD